MIAETTTTEVSTATTLLSTLTPTTEFTTTTEDTTQVTTTITPTTEETIILPSTVFPTTTNVETTTTEVSTATTLLSTITPTTELTTTTEDTTTQPTTAQTTILTSTVFATTTIAETTSTEVSTATTLLSTLTPTKELTTNTEDTTQVTTITPTTTEPTILTSTVFPTTTNVETTTTERSTATTLVSTLTPTTELTTNTEDTTQVTTITPTTAETTILTSTVFPTTTNLETTTTEVSTSTNLPSPLTATTELSSTTEDTTQVTTTPQSTGETTILTSTVFPTTTIAETTTEESTTGTTLLSTLASTTDLTSTTDATTQVTTTIAPTTAETTFLTSTVFPTTAIAETTTTEESTTVTTLFSTVNPTTELTTITDATTQLTTTIAPTTAETTILTSTLFPTTTTAETTTTKVSTATTLMSTLASTTELSTTTEDTTQVTTIPPSTGETIILTSTVFPTTTIETTSTEDSTTGMTLLSTVMPTTKSITTTEPTTTEITSLTSTLFPLPTTTFKETTKRKESTFTTLLSILNPTTELVIITDDTTEATTTIAPTTAETTILPSTPFPTTTNVETTSTDESTATTLMSTLTPTTELNTTTEHTTAETTILANTLISTTIIEETTSTVESTSATTLLSTRTPSTELPITTEHTTESTRIIAPTTAETITPAITKLPTTTSEALTNTNSTAATTLLSTISETTVLAFNTEYTTQATISTSPLTTVVTNMEKKTTVTPEPLIISTTITEETTAASFTIVYTSPKQESITTEKISTFTSVPITALQTTELTIQKPTTTNENTMSATVPLSTELKNEVITSTESTSATTMETPILINGSAVVQSKMVINSSTPVPSESLVLSAIQILLSDRRANITDSVNLLNFTFEAISDTSYAVTFTFKISNISIPENTELRNDTYEQVRSIINNALNTLLNDPSAERFQPQSFLFTSSNNQVYGNMDYYFQDGDTKTPAAFLKELAPVSGSSLVQARMVFNSSSPVPSESLVLSAIQILLSDRLTNLTDSVNLLNFTFEAISATSYAITFTFTISNISMPENSQLRNDTYEQVRSIINNALNTLLNDPSAELFQPQSFLFTSSNNQVYGNMDYYFQDGDTKTPAAFLKELAPVSGSSLVQARMVFNSSSPVPSESLVLSAIQILLSDRLTNLTDSVNLLNFTFEAISATSYAITFTFNISNISMPENSQLRNDTYEQVRSIINNALNTLLNDQSAELFQPQSFLFTSSNNQVYGNMDYYFQDGDTKTPAAFLKELAPVSGSSLVQARMVFNSSSPVPSESLVLSAIQILLSDRLTNLTDSVNLLNFTFEAISATSYAITFTFTISNISMPENSQLRNDTYEQVRSIINNALNTLLNEPGAEVFQPQSSFFMSSKNEVYGNLEYYFQDGDTKTPEAFLKEFVPVSGSSFVQAMMFFNTSSPVPSESFILESIHSLQRDHLTNQSDSVKILNITYEKISDTSYAVTFTFTMSNISIPKIPELRNKTSNQLEIIINNILNILLNEPGAKQFEPNSFNFMSFENQIIGDMEYYFQALGTTTPEAFLNAIAPIMGNVIITIRLVFKNLTKVPSKTDVLNAAHTLLDAKIRRARDLTTQKLNEPVSINDVLYENIDNSSYSISFEFQISNVSISKDLQLRKETTNLIQTTINTLLNTILNAKGAPPFVFPLANYTFNGTAIIADSEYIFVEGAYNWTASGFLSEILKISGLSDFTATTTQTAAPVNAVPNPTVQANTTTAGASSAWILGIIIPCAIIIILIPCWILLCCLLCGCCAGLRRRYNRRRSYNVQYQTHNSLF